MSGVFLAFGCGYVASALAQRLRPKGWRVRGTSRSEEGAANLDAAGLEGLVWPGGDGLDAMSDAWLISVPPDDQGCPVWREFGGGMRAGWIGYLSTTGVYGDLQGRWAFEETPVRPQSREAMNRARAEDQWLSVGAEVFRLPGIYGPGRSALERVVEPAARRIVKSGQVFSRAHRDDIASALEAAMARPAPGAIYNICDDEPAPADEVLAHAAGLLGVAAPPAVRFEDAGLSPAAQRFYAECKRVSNAKAKAALGWRPAFPGYREGLADCLKRRASEGA